MITHGKPIEVRQSNLLPPDRRNKHATRAHFGQKEYGCKVSGGSGGAEEGTGSCF